MCISPSVYVLKKKVSFCVIAKKISVLWNTCWIFSQCYNISLHLSIYLVGFDSLPHRLFPLIHLYKAHTDFCCYCYHCFCSILFLIDTYERSFEIINYRFPSSINNTAQFYYYNIHITYKIHVLYIFHVIARHIFSIWSFSLLSDFQ